MGLGRRLATSGLKVRASSGCFCPPPGKPIFFYVLPWADPWTAATTEHESLEMVVIELEPEPEIEETARPSSTPEGEGTARPSLPPEYVAAADPTTAAAEEDEEAFEDALTDEQLREKARSQANDAKAEGNKHFAAGEYEDALSQYKIALQIASELESSEDISSACHSNRAVCFLKMGKYDETIKECSRALELNPSYVKALLRRAEAHEKLEHYDEAIADMKKIIELEPSNAQAKRSVFRLEPLAAEKKEKMKEEMLAKLKDLGNSVLGRFGMSVDNFKAVKDPNTGRTPFLSRSSIVQSIYSVILLNHGGNCGRYVSSGLWSEC